MDRATSHLVQVEIYGQTYNLRGEGDTPYLQELAACVDRRMRDVAEATATVDSLKVAILTALNIADEGRHGRPAAVERTPSGGERVLRLVDMLERCFAEV